MSRLRRSVTGFSQAAQMASFWNLLSLLRMLAILVVVAILVVLWLCGDLPLRFYGVNMVSRVAARDDAPPVVIATVIRELMFWY